MDTFSQLYDSELPVTSQRISAVSYADLSAPRTIARVIVGSQLHGLATPESDTDYAVVQCSSLRHMLSPFRKEKAPRSISEGGDLVTFELNHFVKLATSGNPTVLEVLWSNKCEETSLVWTWLYSSRRSLLNKRNVYNAHVGYAKSQVDRAGRCPSDERRMRKAWAAHIRVLVQGRQLLEYADFSPQINAVTARVINHIKHPETDLATAEALFNQGADYARYALDNAYEKSQLPEHIDQDALERFLEWAYTNEGEEWQARGW
jgi:predicted nucleotidyltransferase